MQWRQVWANWTALTATRVPAPFTLTLIAKIINANSHRGCAILVPHNGVHPNSLENLHDYMLARIVTVGRLEDRMIDGLKLTFSGDALRRLLDERIADHRRRADHWTHEPSRTSSDETEDAPLLPDHICTNEAERHAWRAEVLQFIHDHVETAETYRLSAPDLEFGELLPSKPGWLEQEDYEERNRVGFMLERTAKAVNELAAMADRQLWSSDAQQAPGIIEETDEFRTTRVDTGDGPEVITIERK